MPYLEKNFSIFSQRVRIGVMGNHYYLTTSEKTEYFGPSQYLTLLLLLTSLSSLSPPCFSQFFYSVSSQHARIGVMGDGYYLITSAKAEYLVEMDVLVPYHSPRKTGMMIWVPKYVLYIFLRIREKLGIQIT
jgi:hypothetical protein